MKQELCSLFKKDFKQSIFTFILFPHGQLELRLEHACKSSLKAIAYIRVFIALRIRTENDISHTFFLNIFIKMYHKRSKIDPRVII